MIWPIDSKGGLFVDAVGEVHHISVPSLKGPDGVVEVPYLSSKIYAIEESEVIPGHGVEEFGFCHAG